MSSGRSHQSATAGRLWRTPSPCFLFITFNGRAEEWCSLRRLSSRASGKISTCSGFGKGAASAAHFLPGLLFLIFIEAVCHDLNCKAHCQQIDESKYPHKREFEGIH